jgi:Recombinase/Recombinase zinc beta ribbon domain
MYNEHLPQKKVQAEIRIVEEIFAKLKSKHSYNAIAKDLNKRSIPAPMGGLWTSTTIRRIAENPLYAGIVVIGKTKSDFNSLSETYYHCPVPPEKWSCFEDPILNPYRVISKADWIKIQVNIANVAAKSGRKGRPAAEFGPSIISGLLFCGYCGAPLVSGRGKFPRCFRCSRRRLRKGNPKRCTHTFSIREDLFVQILARIIKDVLLSLYQDSVRILNEELMNAGEDIRKTLAKKEQEYRELTKREDTFLELYEEAKRRGVTDLFEDYFARAAEIRKNIVTLQRELKAYRDANSFAISPMEIDKNLFAEKLNSIERLFAETSDVTQLRTAIKTFVSKIYVTAADTDGRCRVLTFRIDEIPEGLPDFLSQEHSCIINLRKSKENIEKAILASNDFCTEQRQNFFQSMYDNLSDRYLSDKLSYSAKALFPRYWNVVIPQVGKKFSNRFFFSLPSAIREFGFDSDLNNIN